MKIEESEIVETSDFRVLIYPASRPFTTKEAKMIAEELYEFLAGWQAHGKPLSASFKIEKNQFIIIAVDEEKEMASGCSIDALGVFLKDLDQKHDFGLFDRMKACYLENGKVVTTSLKEFREAVKAGTIKDTVEVFDFSKSTYVSFLSDFLLPLKRSWASIYLS